MTLKERRARWNSHMRRRRFTRDTAPFSKRRAYAKQQRAAALAKLESTRHSAMLAHPLRAIITALANALRVYSINIQECRARWTGPVRSTISGEWFRTPTGYARHLTDHNVLLLR